MRLKELLKSLLSVNSFILGASFLCILGLAMLVGYLSLSKLNEITEEIEVVTAQYSEKITASEHLKDNIETRDNLLDDLLLLPVGSAAHAKEYGIYKALAQKDIHLLKMIRGTTDLPKIELEMIESIHENLTQVDAALSETLNRLKSTNSSAPADTLSIATSQLDAYSSVVELLVYYNETLYDQVLSGNTRFGSMRTTQKPLLIAILVLGSIIAGYVMVRNAQAEAILTGDRAALRRRVQEHVSEINEQKEQLIVTFQSIADGVVTTDLFGSIKHLNPAAEELTGWSIGDAVGKNLSEIINISDDDSFDLLLEDDDVMSMANRGQKLHRQKNVMKRKDGKERYIEESIAEITDEFDELTGYVVVIRDISKRLELEMELSQQATQDELTKLTNRPEFKRQLEELLINLDEGSNSHLLCFMDLDRFKVVNDTAGHTAGDEILRQVAQLMASTVRKRDSVARLGGDEFAFILRDCEPLNGVRVMQNIVSKITQNRFVFGEQVFALGASVGLVELLPDSDAETALTQADSACYLAKDGGSQSVQVYRSDSKELSDQRGQVQWLSRVQKALDHNDFELFYQSIERTNDDGEVDDKPMIAHYEVLVRMRDHDGGYFLPGEFIPAASRYGLMPNLDRWVVNKALEWCGDNPDLLDPQRLAINIDGSSLCDEKFLSFVEDCFYDYQVDCSKIIFELTENSVIANMNAAMTFISTLKKKGCLFALDDFGTGMSSFEYLKSLPVDYLKIDGSFVKDVLNDEIDEAVVRSIHAIGRSMNKDTIAEYVESSEIRAKLSQIGVDYVQGYGIARPRPLAELEGSVGSREPIAANAG